MKRLYESSLGPLEVELNEALDVVSVWLFDADGRVATESGDEWPWANVPDLLHSEVGLPEAEAQAIARDFIEAAEAKGQQQAGPSSKFNSAFAFLVLGVILVALGVGLWTIATWILP